MEGLNGHAVMFDT